MVNMQIIMISGILNIVFLVLVLVSCRCIGFWRISKGLMKYKWFQKIFKYHCWYWYGFIISVLVHTVSAFILFR